MKRPNLPTALTLARIAAVPLFVAIYYSGIPYSHWIAMSIFIAASLTDWLDGYLARVMGLQTQFGAFLDPVADKVMVATALILVVEYAGGRYADYYLAIPAAIIICREITVSALREWAAMVGRQTKINVAKIAKVKTTLQMVALSYLIAYTHIPEHAWIIRDGAILLYSAALLTLFSMLIYLKAVLSDLTLVGNAQ